MKPDRRRHRWLGLLLAFARGQAASCTFAFGVVGLLALSRALTLPWPRYDALLLGCLAMQGALLLWRFETAREAGVILLFHALGFALEAFKVGQGRWAYPEAALSKVLDVPLYAGFMYASVGSYMAQAWRRFSLRLSGRPPPGVQAALAAATYLHFFLPVGLEGRLLVTGALLWAYARTRVTFTVPGHPGRFTWPLPLAFALIGLFVFFAENLATGLGAWVYPHQTGGWRPVELGKWLAWTLMVVVAFLIVSGLKGWEARLDRRAAPAPDRPAARRLPWVAGKRP